jgi:hypothetical protein
MATTHASITAIETGLVTERGRGLNRGILILIGFLTLRT